MNRIYIYGVPGTGKSTIAQIAAKSLGYQFVELDAVRPIAQSRVTQSQEPFLYEYTTEAWKRFGPLNSENVAEGLTSIRQAFKPFIDGYLSQYQEKNVIAEAVFIEPSASAILITNSDESLHYNNFFVHREHSQSSDLQFKAARLMQDFLVREANDKELPIIENNSTVEDSVAKILSVVAKVIH